MNDDERSSTDLWSGRGPSRAYRDLDPSIPTDSYTCCLHVFALFFFQIQTVSNVPHAFVFAKRFSKAKAIPKTSDLLGNVARVYSFGAWRFGPFLPPRTWVDRRNLGEFTTLPHVFHELLMFWWI